MAELPFTDRVEAGKALGEEVLRFIGANAGDIVVLGLPRGGVPVAAQIARALDAPLDVMIVRKLGVPGQEEFAMGALASGGVTVLNQPLITQLGISDDDVQRVTLSENYELQRREAAYRGERPYPDLHDRRVILVDDGIATGASMSAAVQALQKLGAREIIIAVPLAPAETVAELEPQVDALICLATPVPFSGVGRWYADFAQTSDEEVIGCLTHSSTVIDNRNE
ncbi:phosphoribosyltransferase [Phytohalomonas tamaricis]|uniref:phosphoribosyltransferase n=1 Tax=Phytohalomonas tamaricis TaxID=2081032 RepID=UPI000D0B222F|nr:phosphoribosyltransferase [Phytohalomonas tamaricis]